MKTVFNLSFSLILFVSACNDDSTDEDYQTSLTIFPSEAIPFYSIENQNGENIFDLEGYRIEDFTVSLPCLETGECNEEIITGYNAEGVQIINNPSMILIGLQSQAGLSTFYFDFGNGDLDTLRIDGSDLLAEFKSSTEPPEVNGIIDYYYNDSLVFSMNLATGNETVSKLFERNILPGNIDLVQWKFENPVRIRLIK